MDTDIHGIEFATKHFADEKLEFSYIADFEDRLPLKYSQAFDWVLHINPTLFHLNNQVTKFYMHKSYLGNELTSIIYSSNFK